MSETKKENNCTPCPPIILWAFAALAAVNVVILVAIFWKL